MATQQQTLVVIGGGAAGFFCAVNAASANPALKVLILEKSAKVLSKVRVSGGGRCNVTHNCQSIAQLIKHYPRGASFLKKAFHHFFVTDTIQWFAQKGVQLKTEADGRMFPITDSSETIINCLLDEANRCNVDIQLKTEVQEIIINSSKHAGVTVICNGYRKLHADAVCLATGGIIKTDGLHWLKLQGHHLITPAPSLFTFNMPGHAITKLMGITCNDVTIKIAGEKFQQQGPLLITHWGLSGPAVLKLSAWAARVLQQKQYAFKAIVNWLPAYHENSLRQKMQELRFSLAAQKMMNRNPFQLPARLWEFLLGSADIHEDMRWADLPAAQQHKLIKQLCAFEAPVKGKTTFKEEFVTAGGIDTMQVNVNTMKSKLLPAVFFAGEVLDIDGVTGGFNFQNAWTTGWIAARAIAQQLQ